MTSTSSDDIVSISHYTFDAVQSGSNPNANELCGRKIRAQRKKGGKTVSVDMTVVDRCESGNKSRTFPSIRACLQFASVNANETRHWL